MFAKFLAKNVFFNLTTVPKRNVYEKTSIILHKEVIDKYKNEKMKALKKEQDRRQAADGVPDDDDMPIAGMANPFEKPKEKCILCKYDIPLDYKNTRLLSQFVSSHTGRIYDRGVTGLCLYMQKRVAKLIKRSRYFGYMPYEIKNPKYIADPKLFDPFKRK